MDFKRILVFRIGHLGDTLVSLPAFWAVRKSFPNSHITLLTNSNPENPQYVMAKNFLPEKGLFDDYIIYPTISGKYKSIRMFTKLFFNLRRSKYDALIYLMTRNRTFKQIKRDENFFKLSGVSKVFGMNYLKQNTLSSTLDKPLPKVESEAKFFIKALEYDNFPMPKKDEIYPEMLLTETERAFTENWLAENCGEDYQKRKIIGIAPASKWESKVWDEERFYKVVKRLIKEKNIFPIVFGGSDEKEKAFRLLKRWKTGANAAGELNIRQAASALKNCELYLGNDTGTMHLAASVGTKCVGIFASIDFAGRWYPFGSGHRIFRSQVECEGCHTPNCFNNRKCLDLIETEKVFQACLEVLNNE